MEEKEITLFGSTGLIGSFILESLLKDSNYKKINVVTRKNNQKKSKKIKKLKIHCIDFSDYKAIRKTIKNSNMVFSTIGTAQSKVQGNNEAYRKIDFDITYSIAKACKEIKIEIFIFVSSSGANIKSNNFYLSLKGELENAIIDLNLPSTSIIRPSLLLGQRKERRFGERIAQLIMPFISFLMPSDYKPISAFLVAKSMIKISKLDHYGSRIFLYKDIKRFTK